MSVLSKIKRGGETLPPRVLLSGPEGIGKSTFGAAAPNPLFICQEEGLTGLSHVRRVSVGTEFVPVAPAKEKEFKASLLKTAFGETMAVCDELLAEGDSSIQTVVIDTTDWLERAIHTHICYRDNKLSVEDYGYGKGYKVAEQELVLLLSKLDQLRAVRKMGVILLAHVQIKAFVNVEGVQWDRYEMKGHKGFTGILREWPDACLFATQEVFKAKAAGGKNEKAIAGGRIMHTSWSPNWDAKNRLGLPEAIELDYELFASEVDANRPEVLRSVYSELLASANIDQAQRERWEKVDVSTMSSDRIKAGIERLKQLQ